MTRIRSIKAGLIAGMSSVGILFLTGMRDVDGDEMPRVTAEDGIFVHDAYNEELVHITLDYIELLQSK